MSAPLVYVAPVFSAEGLREWQAAARAEADARRTEAAAIGVELWRRAEAIQVLANRREYERTRAARPTRRAKNNPADPRLPVGDREQDERTTA